MSEGAESQVILDCMQQSAQIVHRERLNAFLLDFVKPGDLVLMMGAGNIWQNSMQLVEDLKHKEC